MSNIHSHSTGHRQQQQHVAQCEYPSPPISLSLLPPEILIHNLFLHLTFIDLCSLSQVNKILKILIDTTDGLWKNAIKNEMLDESSLHGKVFENEKLKFQYLYEQRQKQGLKLVKKMVGCGRYTSREYLLHKYITVRQTINIIQKAQQNHELYIYYLYGELQNNITMDMMDDHSRGLLTETENTNDTGASTHYMKEIQIKCLKCQSKCYYPPRSCSQPHPYNWFVSYLPLPKQNQDGERIEIIEIYCGKCQRFSLWKDELSGPIGHFVPPKNH